MRKSHLSVLVAALFAAPVFAQSPAPAPAAAPAPADVKTPAGGTIKAVQPGLFEVAGPRVNEVLGAGIQKISATPGKGLRSIAVQSPWGESYFGWPKNVKPVPFTITTGKPAGSADDQRSGVHQGQRRLLQGRHRGGGSIRDRQDQRQQELDARLREIVDPAQRRAV